MKIFLVGATGRTGQWILKAALARGFQVTALVRETAKLAPNPQASLTVVHGDLFTVENLAGLMAGHDAVLSALSSETVELGTKILIAAAEAAGLTRYLAVAGGGILQLDPNSLRRDKPGYPAVFLKSSAAHLEAWRALERSELLWTLVCTPDLADAPATGLAKFREDYMPEGGRTVACGDVAEFMMNELETPHFACKRVGFTI